MADVVWSVLVALPTADPQRVAEMVEMTRLWARHLRGPGRHEGPVVLLTNMEDVSIDGVSLVRVHSRVRERWEIMRECPALAYRHLRPAAGDRCMQIDLDSLVRHPLAPLFDALSPGEMRVAPSMLPLTHPQQLGSVLGRWRLAWYGRVRGWHERLGVSASHTACMGRDWPEFMGRWVSVTERHAARVSASQPPSDQSYLNYLYAVDRVPMRRYGPEMIHHLRLPDEAPPEQIEQARVLHFPVPHKLRRMQDWSVVQP